MDQSRTIIHVDMDAFFAAVEQRDNPEYRGCPVVIGADPQGGQGRGVVSTCSYEAREYGIHSAQPISQAYKRCPHAIFLPVNGEKYAEVSRQIKDLLRQFTPQVEPISIDEAFLDVTDTLHLFGDDERAVALRIKKCLYEKTGLKASLGVGPNKMVAKIASDLEKPDGLVMVPPKDVSSFLTPLPVDALWGVGEKTEKNLSQLGIDTIGDLAGMPVDVLESRMGKKGRHLWCLAHGDDNRSVQKDDTIKSIGHEHTFKEDTADDDVLSGILMRLCEKVAGRMRRSGLRGRTITTKVRLSDFSTFTRSATPEAAPGTAPQIYEHALANFKRVKRRGKKVRLVGVTISNLVDQVHRQTGLFDSPKASARSGKMERLGQVIDDIKDRFGADVIHQGTALRGSE